jgi:mannose-6-phosphate isomerase-like protein (cupin superfamily)
MPRTRHSDTRPAAPTATAAGGASLLIRQSDLPGAPAAHQFIGAHHGGLPISLFLVEDRPGAGPRLHRHPYPELFIVHAGQADFQIDDVRITATAGDILIAPARTAHRFTNTGEKQLCVTAIHIAPQMDTEWLEPSAAAKGTPC